MRKVGNAVCVVLGFICFGLGALGVALPVLPTTPFFLAAAFFFAKGSERFHRWFVSTNLYKRYIEQAVKKKAMDKKSKRNLLVTLGVIFTIGIIFSPMIAKIIILVVAAFHFYYFLFRVKTTPEPENETNERMASDADAARRESIPVQTGDVMKLVEENR